MLQRHEQEPQRQMLQRHEQEPQRQLLKRVVDVFFVVYDCGLISVFFGSLLSILSFFFDYLLKNIDVLLIHPVLFVAKNTNNPSELIFINSCG
jgi:hypothetical protein